MTPAAVRARALAEVTRPGGPFEIVEEDVRGWRVPVFARRHRSLRDLLLGAPQRPLDDGYLTADGTTLSYAQHRAAVASVAHGLADRHGIGPGDRVAILAANRPEWAITFWAATSLGAIVTACNGWWTTDEVRHGLALSEPKLLVGDARRLERLAGLDHGVEVVEIETGFAALLDHAPGAAMPDVPIDEDDPALILFTSGTTGRSKGATVSHRGLIGFVQATLCGAAARARTLAIAAEEAGEPAPAAASATAPQNVTLLTAPMFHVSGLFAGILLGLATGGRLVLRSGRFDEEDVLRIIEQERVTSWSPIGGMGPRVIGHPAFGRYDVSSIRNMGVGGAPTSPAVREALRDAFPLAGASLSNGYGSSETVCSVSSIGGADWAEQPTSAGYANPTMTIQVHDDDGNPVADGVEGRICVRSAYSMLGYWQDDVATKAVLRDDGWLDTGDLGWLDDGLLFVNSRARDMILRSGENVYPIEVEQRLDAHPAVAESAVFGVDDPVHGQAVKAVVVAVPGAALDVDDLTAFAREVLSSYKVPTVWEVRTERLPRNASGKVLKTVLQGEVEAPAHAE
jgi:long-chain acyl-CoA synthetase